MAEKVQRGGEVQPDGPGKGSDVDKARHEQGIPKPDELTSVGSHKPGGDGPGTKFKSEHDDAER